MAARNKVDQDKRLHMGHNTLAITEIVDATARLCVMNLYLHATGRPQQAAAILRLIRAHPATENQTRPQIDGLLAEWGCANEGEVAELDGVVAELLAE